MSFLPVSLYFGFVLTLFMYFLAFKIHEKWKYPITTPLFVSTLFVIAFLIAFDIPYSYYNDGAKYLGYFLIPTTVCFAVPMYKQFSLLKKYSLEILTSVFIGCAASVLTVILLCLLLGLGDIIAKSLVSVSVTTAIAIGITQELGGMVSLTVFAVVITGVLGAAVGDIVCKLFRIKNPVAKGLAIGNSSHAMGTTKAFEMGEVEGAMSSLSIVISGLATVIIAPLAVYLFFGL
ncbi:MAG: LrgB family protein [Rickettsiales bacterium]|jgi:predicted murein hydrolase (TIGR00659 family)|nr:LrgB family protein [Rickettsiales bacterium]